MQLFTLHTVVGKYKEIWTKVGGGKDLLKGGSIKVNSSVERDDLSLFQQDCSQLRVGSPNVNKGIFVEDQNVVNNQSIPQNNAEHRSSVLKKKI